MPGSEVTHPDSKVRGANVGPIWGRQDPGGPHVDPMNLAIWALANCSRDICLEIFIQAMHLKLSASNGLINHLVTEWQHWQELGHDRFHGFQGLIELLNEIYMKLAYEIPHTISFQFDYIWHFTSKSQSNISKNFHLQISTKFHSYFEVKFQESFF